MKLRQSLHVLSAVAIFLAQLLSVVHASQHELTVEKAAHCELCAVSHAAPVPPTLVAFVVDCGFDRAPAGRAPAGLMDRQPFGRPNTRGPPVFLA